MLLCFELIKVKNENNLDSKSITELEKEIKKNAELRETLGEVSENAARVISELEAVKIARKTLQEELEAKSDELERTVEALSQAKKEIGTLDCEIAQVKEKLAAAEKKAQDISADAEALNRAKSSAEAELKKREREANELNQRLSNIQGTEAERDAAMSDLHKRIAEVDAELQESLKSAEVLNDVLKEEAAKRAAIETERDALRDECENLRSSLLQERTFEVELAKERTRCEDVATYYRARVRAVKEKARRKFIAQRNHLNALHKAV